MKTTDTLIFKTTHDNLLFRGDTRPPTDIFQNGLRRRTATYEEFLKKVDDVIVNVVFKLEEQTQQRNIAKLKAQFLEKLKPELEKLDEMQRNLMMEEIELRISRLQAERESQTDNSKQQEMIGFLKEQYHDRFFRKTVEPRTEALEDMLNEIQRLASEPYFDTENKLGMDPSNSVSVTTQIDVTAHFPEDTSIDSYIYFLRSKTGFITYEEQTDKHHYYYAQEIALRDVPPGDVLGAVKIKRHFTGTRCYCYEITGDPQWNPILENESGTVLHRKAQIEGMINKRRNQIISVPDSNTPISQDNLTFATVDPHLVHDLEVTGKIHDLFFELAIKKNVDKVEQILDMARLLHHPEVAPLFRDKNLLEAFMTYKSYFKSDSEKSIYAKLESDFELLCNPPVKPTV